PGGERRQRDRVAVVAHDRAERSVQALDDLARPGGGRVSARAIDGHRLCAVDRDREVRGAAQIEARADVVADEARWLLVVARRETRRVPEYERRRILRRGRQQLERAARTLDRRAEDERVPLERGNVDAERVVDPRAK